jgi:hypothetical protein
MENKQIDITLTFNEFKNRCLEEVRNDNYLNLVEDWQDNILYTDFSQSQNKNYWQAEIYYIAESNKNRYNILRYDFSYLVDSKVLFTHNYQMIDRTVIKALMRLEDAVSKSTDRFLYGTLKELWKVINA